MSIEDITDMISDQEKPSDRPGWEPMAEAASVARPIFTSGGDSVSLTVRGSKEKRGYSYVKSSHKHSPSDQQKIDLNTCDSVSLVKLPGIGPVLSARIIKYRHLLGGFASVDQLKDVYGLPVETFDLIKGRLFADSTVIKRINVNSSGFNDKSRIPYLERSDVSSILKYRELKGRISGVSDLVENKLITAEKARKAGPYLKYDE